jgi:KUP system potassium uptake protein
MRRSSGRFGPATGEAPALTAVLGLLSLVFWALMVVVTTKYVCSVRGADNDCEGAHCLA